MPEPLSFARFAALADAYGGSIARWPEEVREEADTLAREPAMRALLIEADLLDTRLDRWIVPTPAEPLRERVLAARTLRLSRRWRLWWGALGAATALAGAAAGTVAAAAVLPNDRGGGGDMTVFGNVAAQDE